MKRNISGLSAIYFHMQKYVATSTNISSVSRLSLVGNSFLLEYHVIQKCLTKTSQRELGCRVKINRKPFVPLQHVKSTPP